MITWFQVGYTLGMLPSLARIESLEHLTKLRLHPLVQLEIANGIYHARGF